MDATISSDHTRGREEAVLRTFSPHDAKANRLTDYQMQLMLLEQQNKRRICMARQEQAVALPPPPPPGAMPPPIPPPDHSVVPIPPPQVPPIPSYPSVPPPFSSSPAPPPPPPECYPNRALGSGPVSMPPPVGHNLPPPAPRRPPYGPASRHDEVSRAARGRSSIPPPMLKKPTFEMADPKPSGSPAKPTPSPRGAPLPAVPPSAEEADLNPEAELVRLRQQLAQVQLENDELRQILSQPLLPSNWVILHKTYGRGTTKIRYFRDEPYWHSISGKWVLEGDDPVHNAQLHIQELKWKDTAFVAVLEYQDETWDVDEAKLARLEAEARSSDKPSAQPIHTSIVVLCDIMRAAVYQCTSQIPALKRILDEKPHQRLTFQEGRHAVEGHIIADLPYADTIFYHFQHDFRRATDALEQEDWRQQSQLLLTFMHHEFGQKFREARELFESGYVQESFVRYLFTPGSLLVSKKNGQVAGHLQTSFLEFLLSSASDKITRVGYSDQPRPNHDSWALAAESWGFNGKFSKEAHSLLLPPKELKKDQPVRIQDLSLLPFRYAEPSVQEQLRLRGMTFWKCRKSAYVSYSGLNKSQDSTYTNSRFLIDVTTYHKIHSSNNSKVCEDDEDIEEPEIDEEMMKSDSPPNDDFLFMVPPNIFGFDMQSKKWVDLQVDNISSITWDKYSFDTLALDSQSKELITAMVTNKIDADKSTDHIAGKGTGLVLLLHGGPGTGKTLTAESVAELAEKPLYRVTCGDIGTEPRHVEEYLEQVFYLGKIWDCVVLLDEADVFLEQRSLSNLSRNALVSVFLRTLEYYDGILILTSNRVGTFDEAFKSRIQLSLHYPNLEYYQRNQIWTNFVKRLEGLEVSIDFEEIAAAVPKLAKHEINGRQIRNAITTARQLALYKKEPLNVRHLEHSIMVSGKFDRYLLDVHHLKDDEIAREEGIR